MKPGENSRSTDNTESARMATIGESLDFFMQHYHPYLRPDLSIEQLSVITNIPVSDLENYFTQNSAMSFDRYLDGWRIKHVKTLMTMDMAKGLTLKTLGSLSGFSSVRKFLQAYKRIEGYSPEKDQKSMFSKTI